MLSATAIARRLPLWPASVRRAMPMTGITGSRATAATATRTAKVCHAASRAVSSLPLLRGNCTPHLASMASAPKWREHRGAGVPVGCASPSRTLSTHESATPASASPRGLPAVSRLDHLVLTTTDVTRCVEFYTKVLGMELVTFHSATGQQRLALAFGSQKINIHERGREFEPKAHLPVPGALDLCFLVSTTLDAFIQHVSRVGWPVVEGPVRRTGATAPLRSVYLRDPDLNLIEVSEPIA